MILDRFNIQDFVSPLPLAIAHLLPPIPIHAVAHAPPPLSHPPSLTPVIHAPFYHRPLDCSDWVMGMLVMGGIMLMMGRMLVTGGICW